MRLSAVLEHATFATADPVLRAGADPAGRNVRWVHSSEVLEIAPLLRGGELLLTGGVVLATAGPDARRRYIAELAERGVAGVAIETGPELPSVPDEVLEEAAESDFPVVELRSVVPFVSVAEQINGMIVQESMRRLRAADAVSHTLSTAVTEGAGLAELTEVLAATVRGAVVLLDAAGRLLAAAGAGDDPHRVETEPGAVSVPISVHGSPLARLLVLPGRETEPADLGPVLERAAEVLALAVARTGVAHPQDRAVNQLLQHLDEQRPLPEQAGRLARAAGIPEGAQVVAVVVLGAGGLLGVGAVDTTLRRRGRLVLATVADGVLTALVVLPPDQGAQARVTLVADLRAGAGTDGARIAVGPTAHGSDRLAHTLAQARRCFDFAEDAGSRRSVLDAAELGVQLLVRHGGVTDLDGFLHDQLGPLLRLENGRARTLVATLETYFRRGCSKTATAAELHVQRQALYQRLHRIFTLLGGDPVGTERALNLHLAARLYLDRTDREHHR